MSSQSCKTFSYKIAAKVSKWEIITYRNINTIKKNSVNSVTTLSPYNSELGLSCFFWYTPDNVAANYNYVYRLS